MTLNEAAAIPRRDAMNRKIESWRSPTTGAPLPPVKDNPAYLCAECGVVKGLHRNIRESGTHDYVPPR